MGYSNGLLESDEKGGSGERGEQGLPGIGFKLTDDGNFDIDGKRLTDVSKPVDGGDATTKAYVDGEIGHHTGNFYHLRQSFTFYDSSGAELALSTDSITGLLTDYKHGYYKIPKSGDDNYFSTLDIKIRNNLPQSTYSALFYLYGYRNNSIMSGVDLGPILFGVDGTNYNILKYDDDDSTETRNHTKGIIWFTSDGSAGSIELGFRFFAKSITHFVILSRCVEGKVNLGFSPNIFNVSSTVGNVTSPLYFEDININRRKIKNHGVPTDDGDAVNKKYVDDENAKQDKASKSYVDDKNAKQDIAINDKASKSELVNFSSINTGLGYNNPAKSSFSYVMINRPYSRENEKNFVFDGSVVSSIANTGSNANSTTLNIPYKGKYKLILKEALPITGNSSLKIDLSWTESSGIKTKNVYSENFSLPPGAMIYFNHYELNFDLFVDYENSNLKIYVTGSVYLGASDGNFTAFFGLYLDSDVLRKREAVKKYLKLNGNNKMKSDLDIDGNHILKVENLTDYKDTDPYDYRVKDVKSVVNKEYLNEKFIKKVDKDGREYYDLKQLVIKNSAPHDDGSYDNNTLVSKAFVQAENVKQDNAINNISTISADNTNLIKALQTGKVDQSYVDDNFLNLDGSKPMGGNLNMTDSRGDKHSIIGLKDPQQSDSSYAASVNFVNNTVDKKIQESEERSIRSLNQENVFKKVMDDGLFIEDDDDIHNIGVVDKDFHKVNKKTYHFQIDYDNSIGYYSTRLGVNVVYLPIGYYILAFEMFFSDKIDNNNSGAPAAEGRQAEPHTHIREQKETHGLIFSCVSWLAVLLVGAYARRRRRRRRRRWWSRATWRPCSSSWVDKNMHAPFVLEVCHLF